ncbi:MAG: WYL domain-containing protein [Anaerolineales bacterium]|nr:WYL domain-containing protein [Anaerolineales bacterium]MCX7754900.1 WYL domain-containing protein [Anaerolineales bacterium]
MAERGSEWVTFLRVLAILKRLMQGPATGQALIQSVLDLVGADAYPSAPSARSAAFKHDRESLKHRLGASYFFDSDQRVYILTDPGPFGRVSFSPEMLRALALLSRQYDNETGNLAGVRPLVQQLISWLPPEARRSVETASPSLLLDFGQDVDRGEISRNVWERVNLAVKQQRKLTFHYLSPRRADRTPMYHELAPLNLQFQEGHWYLRGYSLNTGWSGETPFLRFRLNYILDDERLSVSPQKVETHHRCPPRFVVHYQLMPEVGRGEISYRFPEMQITRHEDGSAEIRAVTDDVWQAARTLLSYGEACIVLGGAELRREMERRVKQMAKNYGFYHEGF